uniref:Uncharacterized protein n=1 Tax=Amblyomma parvum TaxID=251391 RepID=A0A023FZ12_AMBPA
MFPFRFLLDFVYVKACWTFVQSYCSFFAEVKSVARLLFYLRLIYLCARKKKKSLFRSTVFYHSCFFSLMTFKITVILHSFAQAVLLFETTKES